MEKFYSVYSQNSKDNGYEVARRQLKRLRIALLVWLVSFVVTMIWLFFPAF